MHFHHSHITSPQSFPPQSVAATGGILWVGTESGRLIRHDTVNHVTEEVRGRLGVGRLDNAVWRIFADPHTRAALIILRNADGYLAHGSGLVRPRWLAKLRGLRVVSATWLRLSPPQHSTSIKTSNAASNMVLLGTEYGALFSLIVDAKHEKDDRLTLLWNAPSGERVYGVRVEQVAGKFVATVATSLSLYLFSDALTLPDLFSDERAKSVARIDRIASSSSLNNIMSSSAIVPPSSQSSPQRSIPSGMSEDEDKETSLPAELHFMTGSSGVASRRFVWAAANGVTHGQVAVRRRRVDRGDTPVPRPVTSTVIADVVDKDIISWDVLKGKTGFAIPLSCNLSAFHVLVLYPASVFAFNHISGLLTQTVPVWAPDHPTTSSSSRNASPISTYLEQRTNSHSNGMGSPHIGTTTGTDIGKEGSHHGGSSGEGGKVRKKFLSAPAAGFARDVLSDCIWIYTGDGEFARLSATNEEQTEAWKAAKAMGRFDLAMALAPLVSSGMEDNGETVLFQTREAVLEAQADHAAFKNDWDAAARLYAKTNRPIETVILRIVDNCWTASKGVVESTFRGETAKLGDLGIASRLEAMKHVITYLVCKLDKMDSSRPMQRTIVATLLVQLYSSQLASESDVREREEVRKDFGNFLADRHEDLDFHTAVGVLSKNGCYEEAWNLAVLSGNVLDACEMCSRRGLVDQSLSLLKNSVVLSDPDVLSQLVTSLSSGLAPQAPRRVSTAVSRAMKKDGHYMDHMSLVHGLTRVVRGVGNDGKSREAYLAATTYLFDVLVEWRNSGKSRFHGNTTSNDRSSSGGGGGLNGDWCNLVTFLFVLHAEFGVEADAQHSYDVLIAPLVSERMSGASQAVLMDTISSMLRCGLVANFRTLCVFMYEALGLHETGIEVAVGVDLNLAEARIAQLGGEEVSDSVRKELWCRVARASDDAVGVVERSKGVLHIEDVLNDMEAFECASERVKSAVAHSLQEHKRIANDAKTEAVSALQVTSFLRQDVDRVRGWQQQQKALLSRRRTSYLTCGHDGRMGVEPIGLSGGSSGGGDCVLCGQSAVESVNAAFTSGLALPVKKNKSGVTR